MSGMVWGVDSGVAVNTGGYSGCGTSGTLAWYTKDCFYAPDSIIFWGRYFTNSDFGNFVWQNGEAEELIARGINWVMPISQPGQGRIASNDYNAGFSDGTAVCQAMQNAGINDGHVHLPGTCVLYVYLDVEQGTTIATAYWQGWATAVNQFSTGSGSGCSLPIYACAYIGSIGTGGTGTGNCNQIGSVSSGWAQCYGVWSNQPQLSPGNGNCVPVACSSPGPQWGPNNCSQFTTFAWQYGDQGVCQHGCWNAPVDLDSTNPGITGPYNSDLTDYMIYLA